MKANIVEANCLGRINKHESEAMLLEDGLKRVRVLGSIDDVLSGREWGEGTRYVC